MIVTILLYLAIFLLLLLALQPLVYHSLFFLRSSSIEHISLWDGVVSPMPNPKSGGPEYSFLSGSSSLTCLSWEALPVIYATPSIALRIIQLHKPHHYVKMGISLGGRGHISDSRNFNTEVF